MESAPYNGEMVPAAEAFDILRAFFTPAFMARMHRAVGEGIRRAQPLPIDQDRFSQLTDILMRLKSGELTEVSRAHVNEFVGYYENIKSAIEQFETRN